MEYTPNGIPISLRPAFQEYTLEDLRLDEHPFTIIERTLAYGNREEIHWLFKQYGSERLIAWIQQAGWRMLPRRRLKLWTTYFNIVNLPKRRGLWPH